MNVNEDKNVYEEIIIDGEKRKIVIEINDGSIEENNIYNFFENTIDLNEVVKEIKEDEKI